jgi:hypothetical protein
MLALAIFQSWIWVGVHIGKFVINLGLETFSTHNYMVWELAIFWLAGCFVALQY